MNKNNPVVSYLASSVEELRKVTWPTKEQLAQITLTVVVFSLIMAAILGVLDYGFTVAFTSLIDLISSSNGQAS